MITRRTFVEELLFATAAAAVAPSALLAAARAPVRKRDADPIRIAVIGVRGRGRAHIGGFSNSPDARVVCLCDPDEAVVGPARKSVPDARFEKDLRRVFDDDSIDAVSIATPNHWHSLAAIWALDAGKHVFVEKPVSHTLGDGRALVAAAQRSGLVVQTGTQARSHAATRDAMAWLHAGGIGRLTRATGLCYKRRQSIGRVAGPQKPPQSLDYDLWTGPAELEELRRAELHYDWHWDWNTGNGDIGNQGVHQLDIARWGLGIEGFPSRVASVGGRFGYTDDGETPNTQVVNYACDDASGDKQIVFEVRGLVTEPWRGASIGVVFHGADGYLVSAAYNRVVAYDLAGEPVRTFEGGSEQDHYQNFLDAIRANDPALVNADARTGHVSAGWCHLGNISHRLGEPAVRESNRRAFAESELAGDALERTLAHLEDNGLRSADLALSVGPTLAFDGERERFRGDHAAPADALRQRAPRKGFVVPG